MHPSLLTLGLQHKNACNIFYVRLKIEINVNISNKSKLYTLQEGIHNRIKENVRIISDIRMTYCNVSNIYY